MLCTAALARTLLPLQRERRLTALADALGIEVAIAHRALADAETCARVLCALFPRLCANAVTVGDALALLKPRRPRRGRRPAGRMTRPPPSDDRRGGSALPRAARELDFGELPRDPGVYLFRDVAGRTLYVGKSISIRSARPRTFRPVGDSARTGRRTRRSSTTGRRSSELGALVLENRLIKELRPPGNIRLARAR